MSLYDSAAIVLRNTAQRKLRSYLTILGIVIGVASIVALVTVSQSLEKSIQSAFEDFGTDKINVFPGDGSFGLSRGLNTEDIDVVERARGIEWATGFLMKSARVEYRGESQVVFIQGWDADEAPLLFEEFGIDLAEGRPFSSDGNRIVIGDRLAHDLYARDIAVGTKLEIEGQDFEVVGIMKSMGNPQDDSSVIMPLDTLRDVFDDPTGVSFITAQVLSGFDVNDAAENVDRELSRERSEESYDVATAEQFLEQLSVILGILQGVLVGIATISLIVGSVGIASSMYTSVIERTREVGIMKAVGATNQDITTMFLIEAGFIGFVGGLIGVALGFLIAQGIGVAADQSGFGILEITLDLSLVIFGVAFAVVVGMLSGYLPARQAASLKPVDALRS